MKKLFLFLGVLMALVGLTLPSYALTASTSTNKTSYQIPLGSGTTSGPEVTTSTYGAPGGATGTLLSVGSTPISGILLTGGSLGGVVSIYDANIAVNGVGQIAETSLIGEVYQEVGSQECVFETGVASGVNTYIDLSNDPINTQNGVVVYVNASGTGTAAQLYTSKATASNN